MDLLPIPAPLIDGSWEGILDVGQKIRVIFHLVSTSDGLAATVDSPDQGVTAVPSNATLDGSLLTVTVPVLGAQFQGTFSEDSSSVDGTLTQGGRSFPLTLERGADVAASEPHRPQNPIRPYPYRDEDITYPNPVAGIELAGTLTIPPGSGPFPAVVLISGSGPQDRDESLLGHKPFLVLSDYLTRHSIAILRSDDRGVGESGGDRALATTNDFATDVEAAVAYLKTRPEVDAHGIGLIGHSEGGLIAPMVAARNQDIAFIVIMAGPGVPGEQIIVAHTVACAKASGMSQEVAGSAGAQQRHILDLVQHESDEGELKKKLNAELHFPPEQFDHVYGQLTSPWYRSFLAYDPAPALRNVTCPVLALIGEKDTQVPAGLNLPAIRNALQDGGNEHAEVVELPGLNHLFQHAETGAFAEYGKIEETIAPEALEKIAAWIRQQS
ncbi:MAG: alpha/beta hydrolase family protein [Thermomicrobiales bacterium]